MNLSQIEALFFLPVVLIVYWLLPRRAGWQNAYLLIASWAFYAGWDWRWLPLLWLGTAIDFGVTRYLERNRGDEALTRRRIALAISVVWNVGALIYFKYANFFLEGA